MCPTPLSSLLRPNSRLLLGLAVGLYFSLLLGLVFSAGNDDVYITYAAARQLASHGQVLNYNGVRLEQSSSLGSVLLLALLHLLLPFLSFPALGWALSLGAGALGVWVGGKLAESLHPGSGGAAGLLIATSSTYLYWASSGMEAALTALSLLLVVWAQLRLSEAPSRRRAFVVLGAVTLAALMRPESPFILLSGVAVLGTVAGFRSLRLRPFRFRAATPTFVLAASAASVALLLVAFRRAYFGESMPHPVAAKVTGAPLRFGDGLEYLWQSASPGGALLAGGCVVTVVVLASAVLGALRAPVDVPESERAAVDARHLLAAMSLGLVGFTCLTGGDWMGLGRFLVPAVPLWSVLLLTAWRRGPWRRAGAGGLLVAVLLADNLVGELRFLRGEGSGHPLAASLSLMGQLRQSPEAASISPLATASGQFRDALVLERLLPVARALGSRRAGPVTVMSGQAGMIPFYLGQELGQRLRLVDMWLLTTDELEPCLPPERRRASSTGIAVSYGWYFANAERIEQRCGVSRPDLIFSNGVDRGLLSSLESAGYAVVYTQQGRDHSFGGGGFVRNDDVLDYFFAVRRSLCSIVDCTRVDRRVELK